MNFVRKCRAMCDGIIGRAPLLAASPSKMLGVCVGKSLVAKRQVVCFVRRRYQRRSPFIWRFSTMLSHACWCVECILEYTDDEKTKLGLEHRSEGIEPSPHSFIKNTLLCNVILESVLSLFTFSVTFQSLKFKECRGKLVARGIKDPVWSMTVVFLVLLMSFQHASGNEASGGNPAVINPKRVFVV